VLLSSADVELTYGQKYRNVKDLIIITVITSLSSGKDEWYSATIASRTDWWLHQRTASANGLAALIIR
jgi:hypothetical protein